VGASAPVHLSKLIDHDLCGFRIIKPTGLPGTTHRHDVNLPDNAAAPKT